MLLSSVLRAARRAHLSGGRGWLAAARAEGRRPAPQHSSTVCWRPWASSSAQGAQSDLTPAQRFEFAAASSTNSSLSQAVVECCGKLHGELSRMPDLIQLLVTVDQYADNMDFAPQFVLECMTLSKSEKTPVLIGGAVKKVMGAGLKSDEGLPGVSVLAAVLPGVEIIPFHTKTSSVPSLPPDGWGKLLAPPEGHTTAMMMLSEPHLIDVQDLLLRIQNLVPQTKVIGGVLEPGVCYEGLAVSTSSMIDAVKGGKSSVAHDESLIGHGALFLGADIYHEGAVGCFLQGRFSLDILNFHGCRPVGHRCRVTSSNGSVLVSLDGAPALDGMVGMMKALDKTDTELDLFLGVQEPTFKEGHFVVRHFQMHSPHGVVVAAVNVPENSIVQLHARDPSWARAEAEQKLQHLTPEEREGAAGAFAYSCIAAAHFDPVTMSDLLGPGAELSAEVVARMLVTKALHLFHHNYPLSLPAFLCCQGGLCQGEFIHAGGENSEAVLSSYCSVVGVMRQDEQ